MDELYDDLENFEDVVDVNQLKAENTELKQKLEKCNKSMEILQKDFDLLTTEFKKIESNYSSLLKIARTEIERKTKMITDLNIEKDMLIISAAKNETPNDIQQLVRNVKNMATRKKKNLKNIGDPKEKEDSIRSESDHPSSETSTALTDSVNKIIRDERVRDISNMGTRNQEKEDGNRDSLISPVDRRLFALVRNQFSKLSSDEEFEDLYSSLKPKHQSERKRKRGRDDSQDTQAFYNNFYEKPSNYSAPFTERSVKNRLGRFSSNDRNRNRDKQYNEIDKNVNRDRQYIDSNRNMDDKYESHQRLSPERHRRGAKEHNDYRYMQQYDRGRRLESPPRERNLHRSRERRKSFHGRERDDHIQDTYRYNYLETPMVRPKFHGEYAEPHNKRPRLEPSRSVQEEDRRLSEKQYSKEMFPTNQRVHTCQSPDFSHTEESSNEPIPEIRSTASTLLEDPRVTSTRYVKSAEGNKDILLSASANNIHLQPVDKSLWNLQEVPVPEALRSKPSLVSEEIIDEMDIDKPLSIISMESGEVDSETTDTAMDDMPDIQEIHKSNYNLISCTKSNRKFGKEHHKERSPIDNTSKDIVYNKNVMEKDTKITKVTKTKKHRLNETPTKPSRDENKVAIQSHCANSEKPNILQKLIDSVRDISPEHDKLTKLKKGKRRKENVGFKISTNTEQETKGEKHKDYNELRTSANTKPESRRREDKITSELSLSNKSEQEIKGKDRKCDSELRMSANTEHESKRREHKKTSELSVSNKTEQEIKGKGRKCDSELRKLANTEHESKRREYKKTSELNLTNNDEQEIKSKGRRCDAELRISAKTGQERERESTEREQKENSQLKISNKTEEETKGKEQKENSELKPSDKNDQETSKTVEQKEYKDLHESEKETDDGVQIFHNLEHRVFTTRHIVEGDLELSDESNDEPQLIKVHEEIEVTKKHKSRRKSTRDLEDTTRKTRSKKIKEKEGKTADKISELFGESSFSNFSLITPEELNFAPRHDLPAECCPPAPDDAQDGIMETENTVQPLSEVLNGMTGQTKGNSDGSTVDEDNHKTKATKDNKNRTLHRRRKSSAVVSVLDDTHKPPDEQKLEIKNQAVKNTETCSVSEVKLVLPNEKLKKLQKAKLSIDTNKHDALKLNDRSKETVNSNKRLKNKGEKRWSLDDPTEVSRTRKNSTVVEDSNITLTNENKENANGYDNSEENTSVKNLRVFENTLVSNVSSDISEKPPLQNTEKGTSCSTVAPDVPNLAPVLDEPGLVKTVVISTGVQLLDPCSAQQVTPFNALAASTPAKDLCTVNASEMEPKISHTAHVSVTIERDDSDVPDVRIKYKRRRKVVKR